MQNIFISYRRDDASDVTGRIADVLKSKFGKDLLFKDVDSIPLGTDFRRVIADAVGRCDVLLAIIGDDWLDATDEARRRRIDDPNDFVHIEIRAALERDIPVIPVLVERTNMPRDKDLPEPLRPLAFRNAISVRPDPDFHNDMERLCRALSGVLKQAPKLAQQRPWAFVAVVTRVIVILALGAAASYFLTPVKQFQRVAPTTPETHTPGETSTAASRTFTHTDRSPLSDPQVNDAIRVKAMVEARKAVQQEATKWIADRLEKLGLAGTIDANTFAIPLLDVTVTQRDIKSDQGEPIVETNAIGDIDLKTFDQHLAMPVLDDRMMDKLDEIIKRETALLNRIGRLEETNEQLQSRLAQLSSAQQQKETTNIARASEQVANELKATELYRQALIQQGLGRYDVSNRLLTQAIERAPDYEEARLARDSIEDAEVT